MLYKYKILLYISASVFGFFGLSLFLGQISSFNHIFSIYSRLIHMIDYCSVKPENGDGCQNPKDTIHFSFMHVHIKQGQPLNKKNNEWVTYFKTYFFNLIFIILNVAELHAPSISLLVLNANNYEPAKIRPW